MNTTTEQARIRGIFYNVLSSMPFTHNGKQRESLRLRRPKGNRLYLAVRYENGDISDAVSMKGWQGCGERAAAVQS